MRIAGQCNRGGELRRVRRAGAQAGVTNGLLTCPASQCKNQVSGNIALKPEDSDTFSVGLVLSPTFLPGFTATIDYFNIKVDNYIASPDSNTVLAACYGGSATTASQAAACPLVAPFRNPLTHSIVGSGFVSASTENTGFLKTSGVDVEANYASDLGDLLSDLAADGSLSINFVGTYTTSWSPSRSRAS